MTTTRRSGPSSRSRRTPQGLPDSPGEILASMGNYVFDAKVLMEAVTADSTLKGSKHDMGGDIVPALVDQGTRLRLRLQEERHPRGHRAGHGLLA